MVRLAERGKVLEMRLVLKHVIWVPLFCTGVGCVEQPRRCEQSFDGYFLLVGQTQPSIT